MNISLNKIFILITTLLSLNLVMADDHQTSNGDARVLIVKVRGDVQVDGKPVEIGDRIPIGKKITANGPKSIVQFQFATGSMVMLKDGEMLINKIKKSRTVMDVMKGTIFSYVKKGDGNKMKIRTKNAALGIRGTKFYVQVVPDDTYLCVCDGTVNIKNQKGNVDVTAEEDIHVSLDGELKKTKANKMMWDMTVEGFKEMGFEIPPLSE